MRSAGRHSGVGGSSGLQLDTGFAVGVLEWVAGVGLV